MTPQPESRSLAGHLIWTLRGGYAHDSFESLTAAIPPSDRGRRLPGMAHSAYQVVEHLRICQRDLLDYTRCPDHQSPEFPGGLWPTDPEPASCEAWDEACRGYLADRDELILFLTSLTVDDLTDELPHIPPATVLRQALIAIDHASYHLGQLAVIAAVSSSEPDTQPA